MSLLSSSVGFGYYEIQKTKPQTIGYGLNDSPIGLAAWISEKFYGWFEEKDNNLVISNDEVLSIISLYWFTQSITSSARIYKIVCKCLYINMVLLR